MAQKRQTLFIDDLDGSAAEGTVRFGLDGAEYEIDLNAGHAQELRDALARYVGAARRAGGTAVMVIDEQGLYLLSHGRPVLCLVSGALVHAVHAGQAYSHAGELRRCRPAPADAALAGNSVPLRSLTVSSL